MYAENISLIGVEPVVYIDAESKSGSAQLHLHNFDTIIQPIFLNIKNFVYQTAPKTISPDIVFQEFGNPESAEFLQSELQPNSSLFFKLKISLYLTR